MSPYLQSENYWKIFTRTHLWCIFDDANIYISAKNCMSKLCWIRNSIKCVHRIGRGALVSTRINDVRHGFLVTSWRDGISRMAFMHRRWRNFSSKFPNEWFISPFNWQQAAWFRIFSMLSCDNDRQLRNTIAQFRSQDRIWDDRQLVVSGIGPRVSIHT